MTGGIEGLVKDRKISLERGRQNPKGGWSHRQARFSGEGKKEFLSRRDLFWMNEKGHRRRSTRGIRKLYEPRRERSRGAKHLKKDRRRGKVEVKK